MGSSDRRSYKSRDRSRERGSRRRSRGASGSRSASRSRSPPPRHKGRRRPTFFDIGPGGVPTPPIPAAAVAAGPTGGVFATVAPTGFAGMPAVVPNVAGMPVPVAPPSQQATRHARRIYVGGLPPTAIETNIATFFSSALAAIGGNSAGPGNAVVNVYINKEKNFAFVEFRTVEETSNAMALDGIMFEGVSVRVRRPNDYNPAAAASLGPSAPSATLNLAAIGLGPARGDLSGVNPVMSASRGHPDAEHRVFVGGIPYYLTEEQCRELLGSFGAIKTFELIKDKETGMNKGYGFVVYQDPGVTDIAIAGLNGLKMGERTLTVRRADPPGGGGVPAMGMMMGGVPAAAAGGMGMAAAPIMATSRIVVLQEAVTLEELTNDDEYRDIIDDMKDECSRHGPLKRVIIPRPTPLLPNPPGLAKVIIEYEDVASAMKARNALHGRKFGGRTVVATYLTEDNYVRGDFDA